MTVLFRSSATMFWLLPLLGLLGAGVSGSAPGLESPAPVLELDAGTSPPTAAHTAPTEVYSAAPPAKWIGEFIIFITVRFNGVWSRTKFGHLSNLY